MACAPLSIVYFFSAPLKGWVGRGATLSYEAVRRGASGRAAILRFGLLGRTRRVGRQLTIRAGLTQCGELGTHFQYAHT